LIQSVELIPRGFRKVLILAEDHGDIELLLSSKADDIQGDPDIDTLFDTHHLRDGLSLAVDESPRPVSEGGREAGDATPFHLGDLVVPKCVFCFVVLLAVNARIESDPGKVPALQITDRFGQ
jgi:hypothetical protein